MQGARGGDRGKTASGERMKKKKIYYLESNNMASGGHYSATLLSDTVKLFHSKVGEWTDKCKGKLAAKLVEHDDFEMSVVITFSGGKKVDLTFGELCDLRLLLDAYKDSGNKFTTYIKTYTKPGGTEV